MENHDKLVEFDKYCPTCKYKDVDESVPKETKCDECLETPARLNSHKPLNYKEKK